ncbi:MAG: hypothetical protein EBR82_73615, partial [Caulobacteraceae bacterium]|nr:hypothetical protein [Caulobacteraceae bacterium]
KLTTGNQNTAVGISSLGWNASAATTGSYNAAFGQGALTALTSGSYNVAVGSAALQANTTASGSTAVGYQAGYSASTQSYNTFVGYQAGYSHNTGGTIGAYNCFVGIQAGYAVTTGIKNTIIGGFSGNQGGLDIRTASNYIVLSDGDGNPRLYMDGSGNAFFTGAYVSFGNNGYIRNDQTNSMAIQAGSSSTVGWQVRNNGNSIAMLSMSGTSQNTLALEGATTAAGVGITFPATQVASSNANTLDDYEEGTWTPAVRGSGTAGTYQLSTAEGAYVKIGQQVTLSCRVIFGTITGGGTGYMQITGAPSFNNAYVSAGSIWQNGLNISAGYTWLTVSHVSSSGTNILYFPESGDELTSNDFPISGVSSGDSFFFTITYITST